MRTLARIPLHEADASAVERTVIDASGVSATLFRYESGVAGLRLQNRRGTVTLLPWLGQMIWSACFDGVELAMQSGFGMPRPAATIAGTYGCLLFHSGLLRNGVPQGEDDHPAHGEFPTARLGRAWLELVDQDGGSGLRLVGEYDHVVGFGANYRATPTVTLEEAATGLAVTLGVRNRSGKPMELMYMAHANFAFVPGGRIVQAAPFTPEATVVRSTVPAHVQPTPAYLALIRALAADPARMRTLVEPELYDPEQVFYLRGLGTDPDGGTAMLLRRPEGDAFAMRWRPAEFGHCARWVLADPDQKVAAFALPATCEPEGHAAERRKGHVRLLPPGGEAHFSFTAGYLDRAAAGAEESRIAGFAQQGSTAA